MLHHNLTKNDEGSDLDVDSDEQVFSAAISTGESAGDSISRPVSGQGGSGGPHSTSSREKSAKRLRGEVSPAITAPSNQRQLDTRRDSGVYLAESSSTPRDSPRPHVQNSASETHPNSRSNVSSVPVIKSQKKVVATRTAMTAKKSTGGRVPIKQMAKIAARNSQLPKAKNQGKGKSKMTSTTCEGDSEEESDDIGVAMDSLGSFF
ncbi:hypothetical protein QFC24_006461 [Naganishia onofrii]|uniref:Uncharacterized protein n=1 Tax=Naganishia onofrii TaxID=1851511 RepID=A0ACC2X0J3_9TREE|nr:hypothetical protein QFC24_006461 [Naganishia onofrii]